MTQTYRFDTATSAELAAHPLDGDIMILPVGAPENHGAHLPLGTDAIVSEALAERVGKYLAETYPDDRVWLHPAWHLGGATIRGVGSVKVPSRILRKTLKSYLRTFLKQGFRRFVLITAHGGVPHTGAMDDVCAWLRRKTVSGKPVQAVSPAAHIAGRAYMGLYADRLRAAGVELSEQEVGDYALDLHAGRMETSMMLAIDPDLVVNHHDVPPIRPPEIGWLRLLQRGIEKIIDRWNLTKERTATAKASLAIGANDLAWIIRGRNEGYVGWPHKASAAEGEVILDSVSADIAVAVFEVFEGKMSPLSLRSAAYLLRRLFAGMVAVPILIIALLLWLLF